jgi:hypothetical protein
MMQTIGKLLIFGIDFPFNPDSFRVGGPPMPMRNQDARAAVREAIKLAELPGRIVNAYETAANILRTLPQLDMALEEIVDMMIEMPGSVSAFEFSPPAAVIEIFVPSESECQTRIHTADSVAKAS